MALCLLHGETDNARVLHTGGAQRRSLRKEHAMPFSAQDTHDVTFCAGVTRNVITFAMSFSVQETQNVILRARTHNVIL